MWQGLKVCSCYRIPGVMVNFMCQFVQTVVPRYLVKHYYGYFCEGILGMILIPIYLKYLFIYLAAWGLSCSMGDGSWQHTGFSLVVACRF